MSSPRRPSRDGSLLPERLVYYVLVRAIVIAVLVLGGLALQTMRSVEQARRQTVLDVTATLATERVNLLDGEIVRQDNVVASQADATNMNLLPWLATAPRLTPTIRAILVLDLTYDTRDVLAFASKNPGPDDDAFRRLLLYKLYYKMDLEGSPEEPRHLHEIVDDTQYLVSYWQRERGGRRLMVVAWHDVDRIVK